MGKEEAQVPLISVLMPVYNGRRFLVEAIESILRQSYENFELLIINDASEDESLVIAKHYQRLYPQKIKIINLKKRRGAFAAINSALPFARGEFLAPMDADDVAHPRRLEKEVDYLLSHPEVIVVGSWAKIIDGEGKIMGEKVFPTNHKEIYQTFAWVHPLVHPSCLIRRSLLPDQNKLYFAKYGVNDEYFTFFHLLRFGKFANLPKYLLEYRIHGKNSSLQNLKEKFYNTVRIRLQAIKDFGYRPNLISWIKFLWQVFLVSLIPARFLLPLYLLRYKKISLINPVRLIKKDDFAPAYS